MKILTDIFNSKYLFIMVYNRFHDPDAENPKMQPIEVSTYETWRAMEQLVTEGLVKYVSSMIISNYFWQ